MEAHLAPAWEPVAGDLPVAHELAQVLHVDLQQLGSVSRGEHAREVRSGIGGGGGHIPDFTPLRTCR